MEIPGKTSVERGGPAESHQTVPADVVWWEDPVFLCKRRCLQSYLGAEIEPSGWSAITTRRPDF
jgi:hypothetical protein